MRSSGGASRNGFGDSARFTLVGAQAVTVDCGICRLSEESSDTFAAQGTVVGGRIEGTFTELVRDRCAGEGPDCSAFLLECVDAEASGTFEVQILPLTSPTLTPTGGTRAVASPTPSATAAAGRRYRLAAPAGPGDAVLVLDRTAALPALGALRIGAELVGYQGVAGSMVVGLARGLRRTQPAAHEAGSPVQLVGEAGDANCDGAITAADLVAVVQGWGGDASICTGDVDGDGTVDDRDARAGLRLVFAGALARAYERARVRIAPAPAAAAASSGGRSGWTASSILKAVR